MKKNPKTQTLWAVVDDDDGKIISTHPTKEDATEYAAWPEGLSVRRLTVPAFAPKPKRRAAK